MIKQSQDDGVDEVTWRISPVDQRLRSLTTKAFQDEVSAPSIGLKQNMSSLRSCSQEKVCYFDHRGYMPLWSRCIPIGTKPLKFFSCVQNSVSLGGRLIKGVSSPTMVSDGKVLGHSRNVFLQDTLRRDGCDKYGDSNIVSNSESQATFRTPPSVPCGPLEVNYYIFCKNDNGFHLWGHLRIFF